MSSEVTLRLVRDFITDDEWVSIVASELPDVCGPHPDEVAGIISDETAEKMRERLDRKGAVSVAEKRELREQFE